MEVQIPSWGGTILRVRIKERPIVKHRDTLRSSVQKRLNRSRCRLGYGLGWAQGSMYYIEPRKDTTGHDRQHSAASCAKTAEPIDLTFGLWTPVGRRKHKFNRICQVAPMCPYGRAHYRNIWQIRLNRPSAAAMRPYVKLL